MQDAVSVYTLYLSCPDVLCCPGVYKWGNWDTRHILDLLCEASTIVSYDAGDHRADVAASSVSMS